MCYGGADCPDVAAFQFIYRKGMQIDFFEAPSAQTATLINLLVLTPIYLILALVIARLFPHDTGKLPLISVRNRHPNPNSVVKGALQWWLPASWCGP